MTTLVHITSPPEEDPRCRVLASAIRHYMQAEAETEPETKETEEAANTGTHTEEEEEEEEEEQTQEQEEIHPPPPKSSTLPFTSHITPTLAMLAANLPLHRTYRPSRQSRPLAVWERGYWRYHGVACTHPDTGADPGAYPGTGPNTRTETDGIWPFLKEIIHQGKAGWGVWAVQTHARSTMDIKIYCWGQVVPYIYLLFLVGSDRHLNNALLQWRDAADQIVVQM